VIKYPNWYEHFTYAGFDWKPSRGCSTGSTRAPKPRPGADAPAPPGYQSYSIVRYFENVKPGGTGRVGGSLRTHHPRPLRGADRADHVGEGRARSRSSASRTCSPDSPARRIVQGGEPVARWPRDARADRRAPLAARQPHRVSAYKPYHSSGEDFLHSFLGIIGIPMELKPQFEEDAPVVFLNESARYDPGIVGRIEKRLLAGKPVVVTSGFVKALQGRASSRSSTSRCRTARSSAAASQLLGGVWRQNTTSSSAGSLRTNDSWRRSRPSPEQTASRSCTTRTMEGPPLRPHRTRQLRDLYALPAPVLDHVRRQVTKGCPFRLQGPARCRSSPTTTTRTCPLVPRTGWAPSSWWRPPRRIPVDLQTGAVLPGQARARKPSSRSSSRARVPGLRAPEGGDERAFGAAFAVNQKLAAASTSSATTRSAGPAKARFKEGNFAKIREAGFTSVRINLAPLQADGCGERLGTETVVGSIRWTGR